MHAKLLEALWDTAPNAGNFRVNKKVKAYISHAHTSQKSRKQDQ